MPRNDKEWLELYGRQLNDLAREAIRIRNNARKLSDGAQKQLDNAVKVWRIYATK